VSIEQSTELCSDNVTGTSLSAAYETRDFYLACFLRFAGYKLIDLRDEGPRKIFVFRDRPSRREDVLAFYGDGAKVPPLGFSNTIRDMKALLHNA
jgi:hypothetical protein